MLCEILKDSYTLFDIAYIFKLSNVSISSFVRQIICTTNSKELFLTQFQWRRYFGVSGRKSVCVLMDITI